MTLTELAGELGITKGQASKCAQRGMPTHDVEAAREWRRRNMHPSWCEEAARAPALPTQAQAETQVAAAGTSILPVEVQALAPLIAATGVKVAADEALVPAAATLVDMAGMTPGEALFAVGIVTDCLFVAAVDSFGGPLGALTREWRPDRNGRRAALLGEIAEAAARLAEEE
jgi:hypothetical protein